MSRSRAGAAVVSTSVAIVMLALTTVPGAAAIPDGVGSPGVGDDYFPRAGNGGYLVEHYDLRLRYDPRSDHLRGVAVVELTARHRLTRFNLDLRKPLRVRSVKIDNESAAYDRKRGELRITPDSPIGSGDEAEVKVVYRGNPGNPVDVTGSPFGWWTTEDGAMVANEPDGASTWFPANDHPTDKATFDFAITVPNGTAAVANGSYRGSAPADEGWRT